MNAIITNNLDRIQSLCRQYKVKELYAFGSVTDEATFNEKSDVDLLVEFDDATVLEYPDNYFDFIENLENLFERQVDLVSAKSLRNPVFIRIVNRTKIPLYAA